MYYYVGTFSLETETRVQVYASADEAWQAALALPPAQAYPLTRERALSWLLQGSDREKAEELLRQAERQAVRQ